VGCLQRYGRKDFRSEHANGFIFDLLLMLWLSSLLLMMMMMTMMMMTVTMMVNK
jgi:hypothetical protein